MSSAVLTCCKDCIIAWPAAPWPCGPLPAAHLHSPKVLACMIEGSVSSHEAHRKAVLSDRRQHHMHWL